MSEFLMAQRGRLYRYAQVTDPQMNSWSPVSDANYVRVFNIQTQVWTISFQHSSAIDEESVVLSLGRGEILKGKHHHQGNSCPVVLGWVRRRDIG